MKHFISIIFILTSSIAICIALPQKLKNVEKFKSIVYTLSADSMLGRASGSLGEDKAKTYLEEYFKNIGLATIGDSYSHEFKMSAESGEIIDASNVIGFIDNNSKGTIVIGAHYDHLGLGGTKSKSFTSNKIHAGADDNASGVAMMLLIAEHLKDSESRRFNYLVIAFSGHEEGLYGSSAFISENFSKSLNVQVMINLDMVGRLDLTDPRLKVIRNNREDYLDSMLNSGQRSGFELSITDNNSDHTDASVFIKNGIPAVSFTTGIHDDYHKISDVPEKINYEGMNSIMNYIIGIIGGMDNDSLSKL